MTLRSSNKLGEILRFSILTERISDRYKLYTNTSKVILSVSLSWFINTYEVTIAAVNLFY